MYEVEVKVPATVDRVRERLRELNATEEGLVEQEDTYYEAPHRSFVETGEALRLREERPDGDERFELTYKGPLVDASSKSREEVETAVANGRAADRLLRRLGFDRTATVRKQRERYRIAGYLVSLDRVEGAGEFVEVEIAAEPDDLEPARTGAFEILERLELDPDEQVRTSYLAMLLDGESTG